MSNTKKETVTIELLHEGVELLDVVGDGKTRVTIYRDTRDGLYHWYELEFLDDDTWITVFRVGDKKIQTAIDLFTLAKARAASTPVTPEDDDE